MSRARHYGPRTLPGSIRDVRSRVATPWPDQPVRHERGCGFRSLVDGELIVCGEPTGGPQHCREHRQLLARPHRPREDDAVAELSRVR